MSIDTYIAGFVGTIAGMVTGMIKSGIGLLVIANGWVVVLHDAHTLIVTFLFGMAGALGGLVMKHVWFKYFKKEKKDEADNK